MSGNTLNGTVAQCRLTALLSSPNNGDTRAFPVAAARAWSVLPNFRHSSTNRLIILRCDEHFCSQDLFDTGNIRDIF